MALGWQGWHGLLQNMVKSGVSRGLSSRAINLAIKGVYGEGVRRSDLLSAMRYYKGIAKKAEALLGLRKDYMPTPENYEVGKWRMKSNYAYNVKVIFTKAGVQGDSHFYTRVKSSRELTAGQAGEKAILAVGEALGKYDIGIKTTGIVEAYYREGYQPDRLS